MNNYLRIPEELRQLRQWVVWQYQETEGGKPTKVPYQASGPTLASVTNPATWASFDDCIAALELAKGQLNGLGFVFTEQDAYTGIDLDATEDAAIYERQQKVYQEFDSYSERSVSGKGLHIIIKAKLLSGRRRSSIEMYSANRFFTMTGEVYNNKPIIERQELAKILWDEMGKVKNNPTYQGEFNEKYTDAQVIEMALNAANGDKFKTLLDGKWQDLYSSQSEADFAFVDMVAFYTQARNQIVRIYRASPLGKREKANRPDYVEYMLNKCFDRMLPPVDIEGLANAFEEWKARNQPQKIAAANPVLPVYQSTSAPVDNTSEVPSPYSIPPGLLGEIASFIYQSSPRQVPEIALAAAIAFMAGITGRAYNVSGTGLNQYVLLLAPTGTGKEAMASGIAKLVASVRDEIPAIKDFIGPAEIASGQALLKYVSRTSSSFCSIVGEFGLKMQQLSSRHANTAEIMLKRVLLDIYNKSGKGQLLQASIYAQKENNTDVVVSPAITLLGESTPETFYTAIDENIIADGLLPRFTLIEYTGKRPQLNEQHGLVTPTADFKNKLATLIAYCLRLNNGINHTPMCIEVQATEMALAALKKFDKFADAKINGTDVNVIRHLWNRAHIKVLKLAALVAVGVDNIQPIIQLEHVNWAKGIVEYDISKLYDRFAKGDFGVENTETKQQSYLKNAIKHYLYSDYPLIAKYAHTEEMHKAKVVPYSYINKKLVSAAPFRLDKMGSTNAIKKAILNLMESGFIKELGKSDMSIKFSTSQRAFMVADLAWLWN